MFKDFIITIVAFFTLWYGETNSAWDNGCKIMENSISCDGVSIRFLPPRRDFFHEASHTPIRNMIIRRSDMSQLTAQDFAEYPEVTNIVIQYSSLSFPRQNHLFKSLNKLRNLTIEYCNVGEEVATTYEMNESLERLSLRGNRITSISNRLFSNHPHLQELDLSENGATRIEVNIVEHMKKLRLIDLSGNQLYGLSTDVVALPHKNCEVCRPENVFGHCSQADVASCADGFPVDSLWWHSPALQVKLQGNPLCKSVSVTPKDPYNGDWNCKVLNNCFSHKRRNLFLFEACKIDLPHSQADSQGSGDKSSDDSEDADTRLEDDQKAREEKNFTPERDIADDGEYVCKMRLTVFILYSIGCIILGILLTIMLIILFPEHFVSILKKIKDTCSPVDGSSDGDVTYLPIEPYYQSGSGAGRKKFRCIDSDRK